MKVLIAEDDEDMRDILRLRVTKLGHEVVEAADGAAAWERFRKDAPKIVISDWMMPGLDGLVLCRKIRASPDYAYFILLSGAMTSKRDYLDAMEAGVDDFLPKPIDAEAFRIRLRVAERIMRLTHRVDALERFLPICYRCKRVKDETGAYQSVEAFFGERSKVAFSHGVCPDCLKRQMAKKS